MEHHSGQWQPESAPDSCRIILFGELLADIFPDGEVIGGAPFNVARHLRSFGLNPLLISRIGKDPLGERLSGFLDRFRLDKVGIQSDAVHPTGQVRVDLQGSQHSFRILPEQAYDYVNAKVARLLTLSRKPDLIYFGTLAQRHPVSRQALRTLLKTAESPRFLDLNLRAPWYDEATLRESLHAAEVVKLNLEELAVLAGMFDLSGQSARDHGWSLMQRFPIQKLVVTAGPRGAWLLHADGCEAYVEGGDETPIVDSVGAGDAFAAVFILGLLRDWPSALALERADAFARAICGIRGAVPMNEDLHARFLADWGQ